jgi:Uma2 family endonuclease
VAFYASQKMAFSDVTILARAPLTEAYDRGEKFDRYRQIESFQEYVLVSQQSPRVETFVRQTDGGWLLNVFSGLDATVRLKSIAVELPLRELFDGVDFSEELKNLGLGDQSS